MYNFPRQVVISPGFGGALSTSAYELTEDVRYTVAESQALIDACEAGATQAEAAVALVNAGFDQHTVSRFFEGGGWEQATVAIVTGPYYIHEYDGYESLVLFSDMYVRGLRL